MKLQIAIFSTLAALTFAGKIPVPEIKKKTQKQLDNLQGNVEQKVQAFLNKNGIEIDASKKLNNVLKSGTAQGKAFEKKANAEFNNLQNKFGGWDLNQFIDAGLSFVNTNVDKQEQNVGDSAKGLIDIAQQALNAAANAGKAALGDKAEITVNKGLNGVKHAAQKQLNSKQVQQLLAQANKKVKGN